MGFFDRCDILITWQQNSLAYRRAVFPDLLQPISNRISGWIGLTDEQVTM